MEVELFVLDLLAIYLLAVSASDKQRNLLSEAAQLLRYAEEHNSGVILVTPSGYTISGEIAEGLLKDYQKDPAIEDRLNTRYISRCEDPYTLETSQGSLRLYPINIQNGQMVIVTKVHEPHLQTLELPKLDDNLSVPGKKIHALPGSEV